jgi:hypothetical protein
VIAKMRIMFAVVGVLVAAVAFADDPPPPPARDPPPADGAAALPLLGDPRPPDAAAWRQLKVVEGITVRLAPSTTRAPWGSAEGLIDAPVERVLGHLTQFERLVGRVPRLTKVTVLKREPTQALVYFYYDLPWPVANRDYTATYRWGTAGDGSASVVIETANAAGPPPGDAVRVGFVRGQWQLRPTADGKTAARYDFLGDYGGNMTKGMIEQTAWKQPLETIKTIRKVMSGTVK